jgi:hypothetical protein
VSQQQIVAWWFEKADQDLASAGENLSDCLGFGIGDQGNGLIR